MAYAAGMSSTFQTTRKEKENMKKIFAIALSLMLMLGCFGFASAEGSPEDIIVVGNPAQEIVIENESALGYDAANEYYIVNGTEAVILVKLPADADPAQTYYQYPIGFDFPTIYFTELNVNEDGYYECPMPVDSMETAGFPMSDFQLYINQDGNQDTHWPDYLINLYADAANADEFFTTHYPEASWSYAEEPIETEEPVDPSDAPVDPTDEPVDPSDAPVDPSDAPVDPSDAPVDPSAAPAPGTPSTGGIALVGVGVAAILAGAGVVLAKKKED